MDKIKRFDIIKKEIFSKNAYLDGKIIYYNNLEGTIAQFCKLTNKTFLEIANYYQEIKKIKINKDHYVTEEEFLDLSEYFKYQLIEKGNLNYDNLLENYKHSHPAEFLSNKQPVVAILGHVNHGKTSLLDCIRKSNLTSKEAGKITQHMGAYSIKYKNKEITFLDTPGHEAFSEIRSRGAKAADIAVLVVAANDSVQPQTLEAIEHILSANIPFIVAINKIDLASANINKVIADLAIHNISNEITNGENMFVEISAIKNQNISKLLDVILNTANCLNLSASYIHFPSGVIIESGISKHLGKWATLLINDGVLKLKDYLVISNDAYSVKFFEDENQRRLKIATPGQAIRIYNLKNNIEVGTQFLGSNDLKLVKQIISARHEYKENTKNKLLKQRKFEFAKQFFSKKKIDEKQYEMFNIILYCDTQGTLDAVSSSIKKITIGNYRVNIIKKSVSIITKSDILLSLIKKAVIYVFNCHVNNIVLNYLKNQNVIMKNFNIIYSLLDDIEFTLINKNNLLNSKHIEIGTLIVKQIFTIDKIGKIAGCVVTKGEINNHSFIQVLRNNEKIFYGQIKTLKHLKNNASIVKKGSECGVNISGFHDFEINDKLVIFEPPNKHNE